MEIKIFFLSPWKFVVQERLSKFLLIVYFTRRHSCARARNTKLVAWVSKLPSHPMFTWFHRWRLRYRHWSHDFQFVKRDIPERFADALVKILKDTSCVVTRSVAVGANTYTCSSELLNSIVSFGSSLLYKDNVSLPAKQTNFLVDMTRCVRLKLKKLWKSRKKSCLGVLELITLQFPFNICGIIFHDKQINYIPSAWQRHKYISRQFTIRASNACEKCSVLQVGIFL